MIELYAIIDHPGPPLPSLAPLQTVAEQRLATVYAPASDAPISAEALWRHEQIVEALMDDRDVLPVRYGTRLADEVAAVRLLADRHECLASALEEVRGAVELSVRVMGADDRATAERDSGAMISGAEYLRSKASAAAAQAQAAAVVHEPLANAARRDRLRRPTLVGELLRAAYLVDRDRVDSLTRLVAHLHAANPTLRLLCTGPWPPYSFAER